jgi:hypothetical protein
MNYTEFLGTKKVRSIYTGNDYLSFADCCLYDRINLKTR